MKNQKKNKSFISSLGHATRGFYDALRRERNLRVHFCIGNLICYFAVFFGITRIEWAVLFATISSVITCELLNSAVEKTVDTATHEYRIDAKHAKDFAAAATLVSAVFAVLIGIVLFGDFSKILMALLKMFTNPIGIAVLLVLIIIDLRILFINVKIIKHRRKK